MWTTDFKDEFRTGDGIYCCPPTIADLHARFLLDCRGRNSTNTVTAHGPPFATVGIHGLSRLNVW